MFAEMWYPATEICVLDSLLSISILPGIFAISNVGFNLVFIYNFQRIFRMVSFLIHKSEKKNSIFESKNVLSDNVFLEMISLSH